jgi:hypothetical protein
MRKVSMVLVGAALLVVAGACSDPSLRVALRAQQRADAVQQAVCTRQHDALTLLLYRDLLHELAARGAPLDEAQRAAVEAAWVDRDLVEFWLVQHERAAALRLAGVDARLYADQAPVDLLLKSLEARGEPARHAAATLAGRAVVETAKGDTP